MLTESIYNSTVVADKGYDSNAFVTSLEDKGCTVVIPPKRNQKVQRYYDEHIYKERHLIECFFGKIKNFRHIFPDLIKLLRFLWVFSILLELLYGFSKILSTEPRTKANSPQTNGICERFHRTMQDECYNIIFRKKIYNSLENLQIDVNHWLRSYNETRPHSGKYCYADADFS